MPSTGNSSSLLANTIADPFALVGSAALMGSGSFGMSVAAQAPPPFWSTQLWGRTKQKLVL